MEKIKVNPPEIDDIGKYRSNVYDRIMSDPDIHEFILQNHLDTDYIEENLTSFLRLLDENAPCHGCKGLDTCPKVIKGYVSKIDLDHYNDIVHSQCNYLIESEFIKSHFIRNDFDNAWMNVRLDQIGSNPSRILILRKFMDRLQKKTSRGIYLYGGSGLGKSYLMVALCNEFVHSLNQKVAFVNCRKVIDELRDKVINSKDEYVSLMEKLKKIDILVLDDLGAEKSTDWSKDEVLFDILDTRSKANLFTFVTSEFSIPDLQELYGGNVIKNRRLFNLIDMQLEAVELLGLNFNKIEKV